MSKVEFKEFVQKNTHLVQYVSNGTTTWQKLYELYDLYGEESTIWNNYKENKNLNENSNNSKKTIDHSSQTNSLKDLLGLVKGIDLNNVQKGLNSLDKAIEAFKEMIPNNSETPLTNYEPRPTYKYFED